VWIVWFVDGMKSGEIGCNGRRLWVEVIGELKMGDGVGRGFWIVRIIALVVGLAVAGSGLALAATPLDAAIVKQKVEERGVGKDLKVSLGDGSTVSGEIVWIGEEKFQLKAKKEPQPVDVSYAQVIRVGGAAWWMFWRRR
jgi:hypothetical protein